ncbi:MAG TPA: sodium:proton antiporter [Clostridiales bacterium]|jgi:uncharacterized MnhB-related membrane protein|nr:sodium:proton antiporter [Clostridiales bacterium]
MQGLIAILLALLVLAALAVSASRKLLPAVIIFMSYSLVMSMVWMLLQAPDLAITEAAVGAGITSVLLFIALKRIRELERDLIESEEEIHASPALSEQEEQSDV